MNELKIEYLSPDELTPYENNTRKHSPSDIEGIKKSILDVGFDDPIGVFDLDFAIEGVFGEDLNEGAFGAEAEATDDVGGDFVF